MAEPVPPRSSLRDQTREERLEILRLLEAGAITVDEAATLAGRLGPRTAFRRRAADRRRRGTPRRAKSASG